MYDASDCNVAKLWQESVQNMLKLESFTKKLVICSLAQFFTSLGLAYSNRNVSLDQAVSWPCDAHRCHIGTAIKYRVPDRVKPSFVFFDIQTLWHSELSVRVPGCQKLQMMVWNMMLYSCSHMATVGIKGLICLINSWNRPADCDGVVPLAGTLCSTWPSAVRISATGRARVVWRRSGGGVIPGV